MVFRAARGTAAAAGAPLERGDLGTLWELVCGMMDSFLDRLFRQWERPGRKQAENGPDPRLSGGDDEARRRRFPGSRRRRGQAQALADVGRASLPLQAALPPPAGRSRRAAEQTPALAVRVGS